MLITLRQFAGPQSDGRFPLGALVQDADGLLYGTTADGGRADLGTIFNIGPISGTEAILHNFGGPKTDGEVPTGGLIQASDGNFYGTTSAGGPPACSKNKGCGTIFEFTPGRIETIVHTFSDDSNGLYPLGRLLQGTDGIFYGTMEQTSSGVNGTIFSLATGLGPFVETVPSLGKVGTKIMVLGNDLTVTSTVSFSGKPAEFTVVSSTEITASVPAGATTGILQVTTPGGVLSSNVPFRVTPQILSFFPAGGAVGSTVVITGESLTEATAVSFGGILASSFTVNSDTQLTVVVPPGALTGRLATQTPGGHAQSPTSFTVTPD
jgi:uncharacterized repeat protein (TIGR03803 family)